MEAQPKGFPHPNPLPEGEGGIHIKAIGFNLRMKDQPHTKHVSKCESLIITAPSPSGRVGVREKHNWIPGRLLDPGRNLDSVPSRKRADYFAIDIDYVFSRTTP